MTPRCSRCHRVMKAATANGFGPKCSVYVLGSKPKRVALFDRKPKKPDARQLALEGIE